MSDNEEKLLDILALKTGGKLTTLIMYQSPKIIRGVFSFSHNGFSILSRDKVQIEPSDRFFILGLGSPSKTSGKDVFTFASISSLNSYIAKLREALDYLNSDKVTEEMLLEMNMGERNQIRKDSPESQEEPELRLIDTDNLTPNADTFNSVVTGTASTTNGSLIFSVTDYARYRDEVEERVRRDAASRREARIRLNPTPELLTEEQQRRIEELEIERQHIEQEELERERELQREEEEQEEFEELEIDVEEEEG